MGFINVVCASTLLILNLLALPYVSESSPSSGPLISMTREFPVPGGEGKQLDIFLLRQLQSTDVYTVQYPFQLQDKRIEFGLFVGSSNKNFNLLLRIRGNDGEWNDTLVDQTLASVKLTMIHLGFAGGAPKTVTFSNVQFSKTDKLTQVLNLLSEDEFVPFLQNDGMTLVMEIVYDK